MNPIRHKIRISDLVRPTRAASRKNPVKGLLNSNLPSIRKSKQKQLPSFTSMFGPQRTELSPRELLTFGDKKSKRRTTKAAMNVMNFLN